MSKTVLKIFFSFVCWAVLVSLIALIVNFFAFAINASDRVRYMGMSPRNLLQEVSENLSYEDGEYALSSAFYDDNGIDRSILDGTNDGSEFWVTLIAPDGNVIWSLNKPADVPDHYSLNDVAVMSRWFLNDYPVYVSVEENGLLVVGLPKNYVGKYSIDYSMNWFSSLIPRAAALIIFNILIASALAVIIGLTTYKRIKQLFIGIKDLQAEKPVNLKTRVIFKELALSINNASNTIQRKNKALEQRDGARLNWIAGISHDIRTPLAVIMGYAEELSYSGALNEKQKSKAETIVAQSVKIKKLIEDLNLISSLEYDMQPSNKKRIRICSLIRKTVTDILNAGANGNFDIELDVRDESCIISGDENLIERALFNLINNSVTHNPDGCNIKVTESLDGGRGVCRLIIRDDGKGVGEEVLSKIEYIPKSSHGLGLPMAYKIINVHGGTFNAENRDGFYVEIELPAED